MSLTNTVRSDTDILGSNTGTTSCLDDVAKSMPDSSPMRFFFQGAVLSRFIGTKTEGLSYFKNLTNENINNSYASLQRGDHVFATRPLTRPDFTNATECFKTIVAASELLGENIISPLFEILGLTGDFLTGRIDSNLGLIFRGAGFITRIVLELGLIGAGTLIYAVARAIHLLATKVLIPLVSQGANAFNWVCNKVSALLGRVANDPNVQAALKYSGKALALIGMVIAAALATSVAVGVGGTIVGLGSAALIITCLGFLFYKPCEIISNEWHKHKIRNEFKNVLLQNLTKLVIMQQESNSNRAKQDPNDADLNTLIENTEPIIKTIIQHFEPISHEMIEEMLSWKKTIGEINFTPEQKTTVIEMGKKCHKFGLTGLEYLDKVFSKNLNGEITYNTPTDDELKKWGNDVQKTKPQNPILNFFRTAPATANSMFSELRTHAVNGHRP